jgi:hypothetical protein
MLETSVYGLAVGAVLGTILGTIYKRQLLRHLEERSGILFLKQYMANRAKGSPFKWIAVKDFVIILLLLTIAVVGFYIIFCWLVG